MNILKNTLTQTNIIKMVVLSAVLMLFFSFKTANDDDPIYLDPSKSVEARVADLMNRMTLEDKVYQMNQFVGLEHMKKGNPDDDKENNDAQGFYTTLSVNDVSKMCEEGKIGSFLCNASYCASYRVSSRMATDPNTSLEHLGFRTVMDLKTE
jgi:beta-glucosidase